jgi:hypothetical protein
MRSISRRAATDAEVRELIGLSHQAAQRQGRTASNSSDPLASRASALDSSTDTVQRAADETRQPSQTTNIASRTASLPAGRDVGRGMARGTGRRQVSARKIRASEPLDGAPFKQGATGQDVRLVAVAERLSPRERVPSQTTGGLRHSRRNAGAAHCRCIRRHRRRVCSGTAERSGVVAGGSGGDAREYRFKVKSAAAAHRLAQVFRKTKLKGFTYDPAARESAIVIEPGSRRFTDAFK